MAKPCSIGFSKNQLDRRFKKSTNNVKRTVAYLYLDILAGDLESCGALNGRGLLEGMKSNSYQKGWNHSEHIVTNISKRKPKEVNSSEAMGFIIDPSHNIVSQPCYVYQATLPCNCLPNMMNLPCNKWRLIRSQKDRLNNYIHSPAGNTTAE